METPVTVSDPNFRARKIWIPVSEVGFLLAIGVYVWFRCSGVFVLMDVAFGVVVLVGVISAIWRATVLRDVKIDDEHFYISDLRTTETIPLRFATGVIDRTHLKEWVHSTILFDEPRSGFRHVRFIPAKPASQVIVDLRERIARQNSGNQQDEALKP